MLGVIGLAYFSFFSRSVIGVFAFASRLGHTEHGGTYNSDFERSDPRVIVGSQIRVWVQISVSICIQVPVLARVPTWLYFQRFFSIARELKFLPCTNKGT
jgi:hypothetical protein